MQLRAVVEHALGDEQPGQALRRLVRELHTAGWPKPELYRAFHDLLKPQQGWELTGAQEDLLRDEILDALTGWCLPERRLLPEEQDVVG
ncbi:hypothetical protein [Deinococcus hopiensis]|uniref:Uncharacterized protein n=1 Tax=Deinococcus hopiensis KR-140 TaxID=695939 RepID=A0A1W1UKE3_9DEIO|nr:hypothetical protein [Deinococcus hopiensis]SMB81261.1 hypothetical protein SAMN00790413_04516 [Deinococcus hopiensis KR-140]